MPLTAFFNPTTRSPSVASRRAPATSCVCIDRAPLANQKPSVIGSFGRICCTLWRAADRNSVIDRFSPALSWDTASPSGKARRGTRSARLAQSEISTFGARRERVCSPGNNPRVAGAVFSRRWGSFALGHHAI